MPLPQPTGRRLFLLGVALVALLLRLYRIGHLSLWYDEAATWWNATRDRWIDTVMAESNHPPVWWIVTRAWWAVFPGAEAALRMPAAVCGVLAVVLAFLLARRLSDPARVPSRGGFLGGDPSAPYWVAALAAVNPFWIEYAQEARMYSALLVEALLLSLLYLRYLDRGGRGALVGYGLVAALGLYTHYFAGFVIAGHAGHAIWLWRRQRRTAAPFSPWPVLATQGAAGLLFVPWFVVLVRGYRGVFSQPTSPILLLGNALWRMGAGPGLGIFDGPRHEPGARAALSDYLPCVLGPALLWYLPILLGVRAIWRDRGGRAFVLGCVLVPVALSLLVSLQWTLVSEKYLIFTAPFLLYLAVLGALSVRGLARVALLGALLAFHAASLLAYHGPELPVGRVLAGDRPYGKEQWRDLHRWVVERVKPGDAVLVHAPFVRSAWDFYEATPRDGAAGTEDRSGRGRVAAAPLPPIGEPPGRMLTPDDVVRLYPGLAGAGQVFLVLSHQTTSDPYYYSDVLLTALETLHPGREWAREKVVFPQAWGVRVHRFFRTGRGP